MTAWAQQSRERFRALGERLQAGPLEQLVGSGPSAISPWPARVTRSFAWAGAIP